MAGGQPRHLVSFGAPANEKIINQSIDPSINQ
jgi:hypothetical protein